MRSTLESAEIRMIRQSNAVAHPTLYKSMVDYDPHPLMLTAILDPMAVMLAYKVAASDLKLWPFTETVGDQFHLYPSDNTQVKTLSLMVIESYDHCRNLYYQQFLQQEDEA